MRHALLFVGSLALATACGDSTKDEFGLPLPTETPTEANAKPSTPDISVSVSALTIDGAPAAEALIYGVHNAQGALLGRLDVAGKIELSTPYRRLLVRRRYDEVEIVDVAAAGPIAVQLVPISERPETVNIFGVGLESILHRGRLEFEAQGDIVMGVEQLPGEPSRVRALCINAKTGVTQEIAVVEMTPDAISYKILAIGNGVFAIYIASAVQGAANSWSMFLVDGTTQTVLAERSGVRHDDGHAFGKGRAGEFVLLGADGDSRKLDYFFVNQSLEVTSQTYDFEDVGLGDFSQPLDQEDVIVGVADGEVFVRESFVGLHVVDALSGANRLIEPGLEEPESIGFWFNDGLVHWIHLTGSSLMYGNSDDQRSVFNVGARPSDPFSQAYGRGSAASILVSDLDSPRSFFLNASTGTLRELTKDLNALANATPIAFRVFQAGDAFALVSFGIESALYLEAQPDGTGLTLTPIPGILEPTQCHLTLVSDAWENRWSDDFAQVSRWLLCDHNNASKLHLFDTQTGLQRSHFVRPAALRKTRDGTRIYGRLRKDEKSALISFDADAPQ